MILQLLTALALAPVYRVDFTPNTISCLVGQKVPAKAAIYRNGNLVNERADFFSKNGDIASTSRIGDRTANVICKKAGKIHVGASYKGKRDSSLTAVKECVVNTLDMTPSALNFTAGGEKDTVDLVLTTNCNVTDTVSTINVASRSAAIATSSKVGNRKVQVTAVSTGFTYIVAVIGTLRDSTSVCVGTAVDVAITPTSLSLTEGSTGGISATMSDCSGAVTGMVDWESADEDVATVASTGDQTANVTGVTAGDAYIRAIFSGSMDSIPAHITAEEIPTACSGVNITSAQSIQTAVNGNPTGTTFCLGAGTFRLNQVTPKANQKFIGQGIGSTVVSGAKLLTSWTDEGSSRWSVSGQTQQGPVGDATHCETGQTDCQWPEDLWRDDILMDRVTSLSACTSTGANKWFFDYSADKIYVCGWNPTSRTVETSATNKAFISNVTGVEIRDMTVEKYATQDQHGMIGISGNASNSGGTNWTIENVRARHSHAVGIRMGNSWQVTDSRVDENGQLGISAGGTGSVVDNLECDHNKTVGYKVGFAGGCSKFHGTTDFVIRNSFIHHNDGNGIWLDIDNIDYLVEDNRVEDNYGQGIFTEISYDGVIRNNQIRRNGHERGGSWLYGAGILIAHTRNVEVYGNILDDNWNGIAGIQQSRGTGQYGERILMNLDVHDNVVCMLRGKTGVGDTDQQLAYTAGRNNKFTNNDYKVKASPTSWWTWEGSARTFSSWQSEGMDAAGSSTTVTSC